MTGGGDSLDITNSANTSGPYYTRSTVTGAVQVGLNPTQERPGGTSDPAGEDEESGIPSSHPSSVTLCAHDRELLLSFLGLAFFMGKVTRGVLLRIK